MVWRAYWTVPGSQVRSSVPLSPLCPRTGSFLPAWVRATFNITPPQGPPMATGTEKNPERHSLLKKRYGFSLLHLFLMFNKLTAVITQRQMAGLLVTPTQTNRHLAVRFSTASFPLQMLNAFPASACNPSSPPLTKTIIR